jgi:hypothetical protein
MKTFTFINDEKLCKIIDSAKTHIIYTAPSISIRVAKSLCAFVEDNEKAHLRVIVDADAEAFRLGFGEYAGLRILADKLIDIRCAKGLRIAFLVADKLAWVYSPTPEIIFEQPSADINNAIQVSVEFAEQLLLSVAPDVFIRSADRVSGEGSAEVALPEIGGNVLTNQVLATIEKDLDENPPLKFDAVRKVRIYQGYFQFVELSLTGCQLNRHTIDIPQTLLNIAQDSNLQNRIRSTCRLVDNTSEFSRKLKDIEAQVRELRKHFIKPLGEKYGSVILRRAREDFEKEVEVIRKNLYALRNEVKGELQQEIDNSRENLIKMLLPGVMNNPPKALTAQLFEKLTEEIATKFIADKLDKRIPETESLIGEMKLNCYYKDVTFETLNDPDFINAIEERYPYNNFAKLYSEQEAIAQR